MISQWISIEYNLSYDLLKENNTMNYQKDVRTFMQMADQAQGDVNNADFANSQNLLYMSLIEEELEETRVAYAAGDIVEVADGVADMVWVILGLAESMGIDFDSVWNEVKASNMSKVVDGKLMKRPDGKVMKPDGYFRPNIKGVLFGE